MPIRIGLTGGIGSGKSTVAALLAARSARVVDTDRIARQLTEPQGAAVEAIRAAFGGDFVGADGGLDRARMRAAAFADASARMRLEAILHPLIGREAEVQAAAPGAGVAVVLDIPLLVESGRWRARVDRVWLVDCSERLQVERVGARPGWSAEAARAVIAQQATRADRRAAADAVIDNDGIGLEQLEREVDALWNELLREGSTMRP